MQILKLIIQPIKFGGPALSLHFIGWATFCNADFCDRVDSTAVATDYSFPSFYTHLDF